HRGAGIVGAAGEADAEHRVDDDIASGWKSCRYVHGTASLEESGRRTLGQRAARCLATGLQHAHVAPGFERVPCQHIAVAAVVARAAGHDDALCLRPVLQQEAPGGSARALHQREVVAVKQGNRLRLDAADACNVVQRRGRVGSGGVHGPDSILGAPCPSFPPALRSPRAPPPRPTPSRLPRGSARWCTRPASSAAASPASTWAKTRATCATGSRTASTARWTGWRATATSARGRRSWCRARSACFRWAWTTAAATTSRPGRRWPMASAPTWRATRWAATTTG